MSDVELEYGSDHEVSENHSKLIEAVSQLDKGQRVKKPRRSEPSLEVSEFHLVKSGISDNDAVLVDDLAKTLGSKGHHAEIGKKLRATQKKAKVLAKPLEKPAADKLKRMVGFQNTKKDLNVWNAIVAKNRAAESLSFPLNKPSTRMLGSEQFVKRFRLQSDLEKELATLEPPKPVEEEKVDDFPLTLEEIIQKRKDAAKSRAQQSYRQAKAYRQNKIKSKKFHRIQRKAKIKQQLKEFEELQKTDPQAALEKLEQLDKSRAEERMSLRHKSTGQWAKSKQVRAKYDKESRQVLAQQLSISKELTQKIRSNVDSDEDEEVSNEILKPSANDRDNPWVNGIKTTAEIDDFISGYRKYWDEKNKASKDNKLSTNGQEIEEGSTKNKKVKTSKLEVCPENPVESVTEVYEETKENTGMAKKLKLSKVSQKGSTQKSSRSTNKSDNVTEVPKETEISNGIAKKVKSKNVDEPKKAGTVAKKVKSKNVDKPKKSGTSKWYIEPLTSESTEKKSQVNEHLGIDDLFDSIEDKIISRIDTKLKSVKRKLATNAAAYKKCNNPKTNKISKGNSADLSFKKQKLRPDLDEAMDESTGISGNQAIKKPLSVVEDSTAVNGHSLEPGKTNMEIDPTKFINVKPKHLKTQLPDTITGGDEALDDSDDENDQHNIISEAFADDDVVEEFRKEKAEEIKNSESETIDLRLPGWGSWGGKDIVASNRKKRRFVLKFPKEVPRRDENKGDVIIIEEADPKIKKHQVSDLPYPFNSVKDFEASIRAPIGRNFVPENAHNRFIRPAVKTQMGEVIEPMDTDVLLKKNPKPRKQTPGLKKNKKKVNEIKL